MVRQICILLIGSIPLCGGANYCLDKDTNDLNLLVIKGENMNQGAVLIGKLHFQSAAEQLRMSEGVLVTEGSGKMLSSLRVDGASAAQTAVVWNGLKLNNALNGQIDMTLVPSSLMNMGLVNLGSSYFGANSMAGTLLLGQSQLDSQFVLDANYGSFGNKNITLIKSIRSKYLKQHIGIAGHHSINNYKYTSYQFGKEEKRLENADARLFHFLYGNEIQLHKYWLLESNVWFVHSNRQLPPTSLTSNDSSYQKDESWRVQVGAKYQNEAFKFKLSNAISVDNLNYVNPNINIDDRYKTLQQVHRVEGEYQINGSYSISAAYGIENQKSYLNISKSLLNHLSSVKMKYSRKNRLIALVGSANIYSLGYHVFNYQISGHQRIKAWQFGFTHGTSFRPPTLNDLYWPTGGNTSLKPERGAQYRVSIQRFLIKSPKGYVKVSGNVNALHFDNQIVWRPTVDPQIWSPFNINESFNLSQKVKMHAKWFGKKDKGSLMVCYNHTDANVTGFLANAPQILFTPEHIFSLVVQEMFGQNQFQFTSQVQTKNFTNNDNTEFIPSFMVLGVRYDRTFLMNRYRFYFGVNNLTNAQYERVQRRPLPGINFISGITIKL